MSRNLRGGKRLKRQSEYNKTGAELLHVIKIKKHHSDRPATSRTPLGKL